MGNLKPGLLGSVEQTLGEGPRRHSGAPGKEVASDECYRVRGGPCSSGSCMESSGAAQGKETSKRKFQIGGSAEKEHQPTLRGAAEQGSQRFPKRDGAGQWLDRGL